MMNFFSCDNCLSGRFIGLNPVFSGQICAKNHSDVARFSALENVNNEARELVEHTVFSF